MQSSWSDKCTWGAKSMQLRREVKRGGEEVPPLCASGYALALAQSL